MAIIITVSVALLIGIAYMAVLSLTKEPELTNEQLAEVSTDREWWQVD